MTIFPAAPTSVGTSTGASAARGGIEVRGLAKAYGKHQVLKSVDLTVPAGTILALLGPNGAGKTTVVNIVSTLIKADAGQVRVAGYDLATQPGRIRGAIGVTGQFSAVDDLLTGPENLRLMARLHRLDPMTANTRIDSLLAQFELAEAAAKPVATYSGGMKRKLDLAMTLMGDPQVVFLDEPTTGLDPRSRRAMWQLVRGLVADGVTILLTTQYLDEADQLADRIAVLDGGTIVAEGTPAELKRLVPGGVVRIQLTDESVLDRAVEAAATPGTTADPETLQLAVPGSGDAARLRELLHRLDAAGIGAGQVEIRSPDLDDAFLALTGHRPTPDTSSPDDSHPTSKAA